MKKKNVSKSSAAQLATVVISTGQVDPVPTAHAPDPPPTGDTSDNRGNGHRGAKLNFAELTAAGAAASELQHSSAYASFGDAAPPKGDVVDALQLISGWLAQYTAAEKWFNYVSHQLHLAVTEGATSIEALRAPFVATAGGSSAVKTAFPKTAKYFAASGEAASKASVTRAKNRSALVKAAKASGVTVPPSGKGTNASPTPTPLASK